MNISEGSRRIGVCSCLQFHAIVCERVVWGGRRGVDSRKKLTVVINF